LQALKPWIDHAMSATKELLEPVIVPVVHHTVVYKESPPII